MIRGNGLCSEKVIPGRGTSKYVFNRKRQDGAIPFHLTADALSVIFKMQSVDGPHAIHKFSLNPSLNLVPIRSQIHVANY